MVLTILAEEACTENSPSTPFSVVVILTGPCYFWDLHRFGWNWLFSTI